ncbi:MAG: nitrile hydratase subunit alpha [Candidatus Velthaea sp.]
MSAHNHDHDHESPGAQATQRVNALIATLERRGVTSEAEIGTLLERFVAGAGPSNGARIVARAWRDPGFKTRLLADANAAIVELGLDLSHWSPVLVRVVENTPRVHNVIVCTLCSCYPLALLGPSPTWYKSEAYRSRVVREPRAVLREFGLELPGDVAISVWDSTADLRYLVLPQQPAGTEHMDAAQLAALVPRDALIGVALPHAQVHFP